jgi:hypothetical protein
LSSFEFLFHVPCSGAVSLRFSDQFQGGTDGEAETDYRGTGLTHNGNAKDGEQSWKLATRGRFRANGYVC